jgi:O-acetyl-ADP-ribose deacetylase (regulator of RNase III)
MIAVVQGDILKADAEALVNTVNCVGHMGRGLAAQFKRAFPDNFRVYQAACKREQVQAGRMLVVETGRLTNPRFIINFPTKRHWRGKSRMEDIEAGLTALVDEIRRLDIRSVAVPPLGCGLGGLNWSDVRPRIERRLPPCATSTSLCSCPAVRMERRRRDRPSRRRSPTEGIAIPFPPSWLTVAPPTSLHVGIGRSRTGCLPRCPNGRLSSEDPDPADALGSAPGAEGTVKRYLG